MTNNVTAAKFDQEENNHEDAFMEWEQRLDAMGHTAPIEDLKAHLSIAPKAAPSRETLAVFIAGYEQATLVKAS